MTRKLMESNSILTIIVPVSMAATNVPVRILDKINASRLLGGIEVIFVLDWQGLEKKDVLRAQFLSVKGVKVFEGEFSSPGLARNLGLANATGKWVTFWDSDDEPEIPKFLEMIAYANVYDADIAVGNFETKRLTTGKVEKRILPENGIDLTPGIWRCAFRRKLVEEEKFSSILMGEDQLFMIEVFSKSSKVFFFPEVVYQYFRDSPFQLTGNEFAILDKLLAFESMARITERPNNLAERLRISYLIKLGLSIQKIKRLKLHRRLSVARFLLALAFAHPAMVFKASSSLIHSKMQDNRE
jgi:glycosyltransferase involved in cell wall biosynthesis